MTEIIKTTRCNYGVFAAWIIIGLVVGAELLIGIIPLIWMINHPQEYLAYMGYG